MIVSDGDGGFISSVPIPNVIRIRVLCPRSELACLVCCRRRAAWHLTALAAVEPETEQSARVVGRPRRRVSGARIPTSSQCLSGAGVCSWRRPNGRAHVVEVQCATRPDPPTPQAQTAPTPKPHRGRHLSHGPSHDFSMYLPITFNNYTLLLNL